jgi:uncharacterized protein YeaC (DUF1315 family)
MTDSVITQTIYPNQKPVEYGRVSRALKYGLVYEGRIKDSDQTFSSLQAVTRWDQVNQLTKENSNIAWQDTTIEVYGKKIIHKLPLWTPHADRPEELFPNQDIPDTNITAAFYDYIVQKAKRKMLSDNVLGVRQSLIKTHNITLINNVPIFFSLNKTTTDIAKARQNITEEEAIEQTALILMKEYLDGYKMEIDYKLSIKSNLSKENMDFPIKKNYDFTISNPVLDVHIEDNYTA